MTDLAPKSVESAPAAPAAKPRILVVDDDRLVLATVAHGLAEAGYEVIDADNGDDAILLAREHRPVLALLDIRMEGKSGFDVAETLRDAYGIPFMFLSAFADDATLAKVQALGAQAYLIKPLDVGQIVPSVAAVLARLQSAAAALPAAAARPGATAAPPASAATPAATSAALPAPISAPVPAPVSASVSPTSSLAASHPAAAAGSAAEIAVATAVGVLMHRYSLSREDAASRLRRLADDNRLQAHEQAERLLAAVEELARSAL